jgi:hypothetical protein
MLTPNADELVRRLLDFLNQRMRLVSAWPRSARHVPTASGEHREENWLARARRHVAEGTVRTRRSTRRETERTNNRQANHERARHEPTRTPDDSPDGRTAIRLCMPYRASVVTEWSEQPTPMVASESKVASASSLARASAPIRYLRDRRGHTDSSDSGLADEATRRLGISRQRSGNSGHSIRLLGHLTPHPRERVPSAHANIGARR